MTEGYGAVFVDRPVLRDQPEVAGAVLTAGARGSLSKGNDPRLVVLSHPLESSVLASTGYTWGDLLRQGRYVAVTNLICRECGNVFQRRRLDVPGNIGCTPALVSGAAAAVIVWVVTFSFLPSCFTGLGGMMAVTFVYQQIGRAYIRRRFAARAAELKADGCCPVCHANSAVSVVKARSIHCPVCGENALSFNIVAIS